MRWRFVATLVVALSGCPQPEQTDAGSAGGGAGGGGTGQGGGGAAGGSSGGSGGGASNVEGDHCGTVIELPATSQTFAADTTLARDDYQGGCAFQNETGGKELVYHLNLTSPRSVTFSASATAGKDAVIYVRESPCETGRTLACADGFDVGETEMLFLPFASGDLYFFVDGWDSATSGDFAVTISLGVPVAPPPNDTCSSATPLTFVNDRATASGDTTGANNSNVLAPDGGPLASPSCSTTAQLVGQDVLFSFTVGQGKNVAVSVSAADGGLDPAVYVRSACDSTARADELACGDGVFTLSNLDAGTYYLWVDGLNGSFGTFDLGVTLSDYAPPPLNDVCVSDGGATGARVLPADGGTVSGTLVGSTSDIAASCGAGGSPDVAYVVTTNGARDLVATVTPTGAGVQPVVFIRSGCGLNGFDLACTAAMSAGQGATATVLNAPAGTYVIWVESLAANGAFTLDLQVRGATGAPANDLCVGAIAVLTGGATSQTLTGDTRTATDQTSSAFCSSGAGNDVFYRVALSQPRKLTAKVTPTDDGGGYFPSVHLRGLVSCLLDGGSAGGGSPGCANGGFPGDPAELIVPALDAGTYFLVVDGVNGTSGAYTLELTSAAPAPAPPNGTCAAPGALTFVNGIAQATASTRLGGLDHTGTAGCVGGGPDVVYSFTLPDAGGLDGGTYNVKAVAFTHNAADNSPTVYIQRGCLPDAGQVVCDTSVLGPPLLQSRVNAWSLRPGPYTVWVDNVAGEAGGFFTLSVQAASAPPANDACPSAAVLPLNTTVKGSTLGAGNHFQGTLAADGGFYAGNTACGNVLPGADVVYQVTAGLAGTYVIRVQPERGFNPALGVTTACMRGACVDTVDAVGENLPEQLSFTAAMNQTFFVTVDSSSDLPTNGAARGGFSISVQSP